MKSGRRPGSTSITRPTRRLRACGAGRLRGGRGSRHVGAQAHGRAARARSDRSHQPRIGRPPSRLRSVVGRRRGVHRPTVAPQRHGDRSRALDEPDSPVGCRHARLVPRDVGDRTIVDLARARISPSPVGRVDRLGRSSRPHLASSCSTPSSGSCVGQVVGDAGCSMSCSSTRRPHDARARLPAADAPRRIATAADPGDPSPERIDVRGSTSCSSRTALSSRSPAARGIRRRPSVRSTRSAATSCRTPVAASSSTRTRTCRAGPTTWSRR